MEAFEPFEGGEGFFYVSKPARQRCQGRGRRCGPREPLSGFGGLFVFESSSRRSAGEEVDGLERSLGLDGGTLPDGNAASAAIL